MFGTLGWSELLLIFLLVLVFFGAKRLPEIGQAMGKGIREFKRSMREIERDLEIDESDEEGPKGREGR